VGGELLTFDEALAELQMATHELRSLVNQGEVRAFRDEDVLKFRRTDILDLKKRRDAPPGGLVIEPTEIGDEMPTMADLEAQQGPEPGTPVQPKKPETEETELLSGIGKESPTDFLGLDDTAVGPDSSGDTAQTVVPTIEIADEDMIDDTAQTVIPTLSEGDTDDTAALGTIDTAAAPTAPSLLDEEDEATEMSTQEIGPDEVAPTAAVGGPPPTGAPPPPTAPSPPQDDSLRFGDEPESATITAPAEDLNISTDELGPGVTSGATATRLDRMKVEAAAAASRVSPAFAVMAVVTFVILALGAPIFYGLITETPLEFGPYGDLLDFLYEQTASGG
jgi:hypothetical protein